MEMVVRMDGAVASILDRLVSDGYFKTKTEALRAGVLQLGREFGFVGLSEDELVQRKVEKIMADIKSGKRKTYSFDSVLKERGLKRSDLK